jgi:hypothetical protein
MAEIKITYGFLKKVAPKYLLVYETKKKKTLAGEESKIYTNYWVWLPESQRGQEFPEDSVLEITGTFHAEDVEKDGKTYKNLYVSADKVAVVSTREFSPAAKPVQFIDNAADILNAPF